MRAIVSKNGRIAQREGLTLAKLTDGADWALFGGYAWGITEKDREAALKYAAENG